jgi:hypothetical protein
VFARVFCLRRVTFETPKVTKRVFALAPSDVVFGSLPRRSHERLQGLKRVGFGVALARNGGSIRRRGRLMRATYRRGAASRGKGTRGKRSPNPLGRLMGGTSRANVVPNPLGRLVGGTPRADVVPNPLGRLVGAKPRDSVKPPLPGDTPGVTGFRHTAVRVAAAFR